MASIDDDKEEQISTRPKDEFLKCLRIRNQLLEEERKEMDSERAIFMEEVAAIENAEKQTLMERFDLFIASSTTAFNNDTVEEEVSNADQIAALETLGIVNMKATRFAPKPQIDCLDAKEFPGLDRNCAQVVQLYHPRREARNHYVHESTLVEEIFRLEKPDFDPITDDEYNKLQRRFAILARMIDQYNVNGGDFDDTTLKLVKRNLTDAQAIKLISEFIWRHGEITCFVCERTKGFESNATLSIVQALMHLEHLQEIKFDHTTANKNMVAAFAMIAHKSQTLRTASFSRCAVNNNGALFWGLALRQGCKSLVSLNLSAGNIGDAGCVAIAIGLTENQSLLKLNLSFNKISRRGVRKLGQALLKNPVLQELALNGCGSGSRGASTLASFLMHPKCKLRKLDLSFNDVGPRGGRALAVGLSSNASLEELLLAGNDFGNDGSAPFGICLKSNKTLKRLDMSDCDMSDLGVGGIALGLETNCTLEWLDCSDQIISNAGCEQIAMRLAFNPHSRLRTLRLNGNIIRSDGAASLAEYLSVPMSSLFELSLADNEIGDNGAYALAQAIISLEGKQTLRKLDLSGNPISEGKAEKYFTRAIARSRSELGTNGRNKKGPPPFVVKADGIDIARGTLRSCGVVSLRRKIQGWYYIAVMLITLLSQWADFTSDVLVAVDQIQLTMETQLKSDLTYSILLVAFIVVPYLYILFMYSLPEQIDFADEVFHKDADALSTQQQKKKRTLKQHMDIVLQSKWTWSRFGLCIVTALQLRSAYEMYMSIRHEVSTLALHSIHLAQTLLEAIPQSLIQIHVILSTSNLLRIKNAGNGGNFLLSDDSSVQLLVFSTTLSCIMLSNTLCVLFQEKEVINWKKVAWAHEDMAYVVGMCFAYVYHLAHYLFRSLYIVLLTTIYGPVLCIFMLCLGLASRVAVWKKSESSRTPTFSAVSFLVGSSSWDKRWAARLAQALEFFELVHVIILLWIPIADIPIDQAAAFQSENWELLLTVIGPEPITVLVVLSWFISIVLYVAFVEPIRTYSDVPRKLRITVVEEIANQPFVALQEKVRQERQVALGVGGEDDNNLLNLLVTPRFRHRKSTEDHGIMGDFKDLEKENMV